MSDAEYLKANGWCCEPDADRWFDDLDTMATCDLADALTVQRARDADEKRRGMADAWTRAYAANAHGDPSVGVRAAREFSEWFDATFGDRQ